MRYLLRRLRRPLVISAASSRRKLIDAAVLLVLVMLVHIGAMMWFETLSFLDAFWLNFTTITTVGYGDLSATTPGARLVTVVLMYSLGIFLLANLAGCWVDHRAERRPEMLRELGVVHQHGDPDDPVDRHCEASPRERHARGRRPNAHNVPRGRPCAVVGRPGIPAYRHPGGPRPLASARFPGPAAPL